MINDFNIKIFDYIYDTSFIQKFDGGTLAISEYTKQLDKIIEEVTNDVSNFCFWEEYNYLFSSASVKDSGIANANMYLYYPFPMMRMSTKKLYLKYKLNQFIEILENNSNYNLQNICNDLNINTASAIIEILKYFIKIGLIKCSDEKIYKDYIDGGKRVMYNKLEINMGYFDTKNEKSNNTTSYTNNFYAPNNNLIQGYNNKNNAQENNYTHNDEKLFEVVLEKLELLKVENNLPNEEIIELKKLCENKKKNKVIEFLKKLAIGTTSALGSVVASGILTMFNIS